MVAVVMEVRLSSLKIHVAINFPFEKHFSLEREKQKRRPCVMCATNRYFPQSQEYTSVEKWETSFRGGEKYFKYCNNQLQPTFELCSDYPIILIPSNFEWFEFGYWSLSIENIVRVMQTVEPVRVHHREVTFPKLPLE